MCSICGIIDFKNKDNLNKNILLEMGKELSHRGPDQNGVFINDKVAFQHNRLAIMDLENGIQPMTRYFQGNEYTIIYNGEIYNTPELKSELESYGIEFKTNCDTEVVLYSYIVFKEECAEKLNGIFAFAVFDKNNNEVYIARDRFGIKPLFYTQVGTSLLFASEIKALLKHPKVNANLDKEGLWQLFYLAPMKISGTSVFKDIHEVKPAHFGIYKDNHFDLKQYWNLEAKEFVGTEKDAIENTRYLVTDAINRQLVSDAPLATFLSGGLDSSIISSVASQKYKNEGNTLGTYSFEYKGNKENFKNTIFQPQSDDEYARYLAHYLGTDHRILTADISDITSLLFDAVKYRDLPGMADIDSSLLYYCSKVKEHHTVALSGECADEIFGGYPWFYRKEMLERDFFPWIHNPQYEELVTKLLREKLKNPNSVLANIIDSHALDNILQYENITWFGQLMSKPQLIAWLVQLDYWFDLYNINIL